MDSSEILHYLDGVVHRGRQPATATTGVESLQSGHHLGHGGPDGRKNGEDIYHIQSGPLSLVQIRPDTVL